LVFGFPLVEAGGGGALSELQAGQLPGNLRIGLAVAGDEQLLKLVYGDRRGGEGEVCKTESTT